MEEVRIISSELVKPVKCLENPPKLNPTGFDKAMEMIPYQQRVLFYQSPATTPFEEIVQLLKTSLAEVLVAFYPLAGRIVDGFIDCGSGQSVRFVEAVSDSTLEQLGEFQPCEFCDSLCNMGSTLPKYPWKAEDPLLLIQVTRFKCGGFSLGFSFNHHVVDGTSAWSFMTSWAELARTGEIQVVPDITYSFVAPNLTREQYEEQKARVQLLIPATPGTITKTNPSKLVTKVYKLEAEMIRKLKADAAAATNGIQFSSFVVIGAYFWRRVTLARQLPESETTRFIVSINCRERIPSLSKRYFGNAVSVVTVSAKAGDVESGWLSQCTTLMQQTIKSADGESLATIIGYFLGVLSDPEELKQVNLYTNVVHPIGSPNHPVYKTDFGFGKPAGVTFGTGDLGDGKLYLFPSAKGDGGVTATIVLPTEVMERLSQQDD